MLQSQLIDLNFAGPTDTKTDSKNTLYTSFTEMTNSRVDRVGAVMPRGGSSESHLTSTSLSITANGPGYGVAADDTLQVQLNDGNAWRVANGTTQLAGSEVRGQLSRRALGNSARSAVAAAQGGGNICSVWVDDDPTGGAILGFNVQSLSGDTLVSTFTHAPGLVQSEKVAVVYAAGHFYIFYPNASNGFVSYMVSFTEFQPLQTVTWSSTPYSSNYWDVVSDGTKIYLYTSDNGSGATLTIITPSSTSFTFTSSTVGPAGVSLASVGIELLSGFNNGAYIATTAASATGTMYLQFFNSSGTQIGTTKTTAIGSAANYSASWILQTTNNVIHVGLQSTINNSTSMKQVLGTYTQSIDVLSADTRTTSYQLLTKPVLLDGRPYFYVDTTTVPTYGSQALMEYTYLTNGIDGVNYDVGGLLGVSRNLGAYYSGQNRVLPRPIKVSGTYVFPVCFVGSVTAISSSSPAVNQYGRPVVTTQAQASLVVLDQTLYPVQVADGSKNQSLYAGNAPRNASTYRQIATPWPELTFDLIGSRATFVSGGPSFTGIISWIFAKVKTFADGTTYRSYTPIFTGNFSANALQFVLGAEDFEAVGASSNCRTTIEYYKTEENGQIFYLAKTLYAAGTYTDNISSLSLISGRLADINGAELYPEPPSAIRAATRWRNRLVAVMADKGTVIKFEKPSALPQGTCFADGLELDIGAEGGDITALGVMDSALYVFKRNQIYTVYGDMPGATGENGTLATPTMLRQGQGCVDARSVILTPKGLMFNSQKGFYMIMRNQEWDFVGNGPYIDRSVTLTGSAIDETQCEVYFAYSSGITWAYNYETRQWYKWTLPASGSARGLATHNGTLVGSSDYGYWMYDKTLTSDAQPPSYSAAAQQHFQTGWVRTDHVRGYQRVKRAYFSCFVSTITQVTITVYTDYNLLTPVQTKTISLPVGDNQIDLHLEVQKCEALCFRFDTNYTGLTMQGATLTFGVKMGQDHSRSSATNK